MDAILAQGNDRNSGERESTDLSFCDKHCGFQLPLMSMNEPNMFSVKVPLVLLWSSPSIFQILSEEETTSMDLESTRGDVGSASELMQS